MDDPTAPRGNRDDNTERATGSGAPERTPFARRLRRSLAHWAIACAAGLLATLAYPPVDAWPAAVIGPAFLLWTVERSERARSAVWLGFLFGAGFFWVNLRFLGAQLDAMPQGALSLNQALYPALACGLGWWASRRAGPPWRAFLYASAWLVAEWFRSIAWLVGFTMVDLGYALHSLLVPIQIADLGGALLVTWLVAFTAAALACIARSAGPDFRRVARRIALAAGAVWLVVLAYGFARLASVRPPEGAPVWRAAIVQPATDLAYYYEFPGTPQPSLAEQIATYKRLLDNAGISSADVVLLPESGVNVDLLAEPIARPLVASVGAHLGCPVATGFHEVQWPSGTTDPEDRLYYNSLALLGPSGEILGVYRKRHLVGFGEYLPFREQLQSFYKRWPIRPYDISPGSEIAVFDVSGARVAPMICFESLFPYEARRTLRVGGDVLVVHTNDGWFNSELESVMHARTDAFRAIENRVPVLRSATTGLSGMIDPSGRWTAVVPLDEPGAVLAEVHPRRPSSVYYHLGDAGPVSLSLLALVAPWLVARARDRRERPTSAE